MGPGLRREAVKSSFQPWFPSSCVAILRDCDGEYLHARRWTGRGDDDTLLRVDIGQRGEMP